jgi:hypothetical protein
MFERKPELIVKRRIGKVGSLRLRGPNGDLGDIDTLVIDPNTKRIMPVECKDLVRARASHEMANEIANLFLGQNGKASFVEKHQRRVEWLREHIGEVLDWLGLPQDGDWQIEPLIVVDQELMTPYLYTSPMRVVAVVELEEELNRRQ